MGLFLLEEIEGERPGWAPSTGAPSTGAPSTGAPPNARVDRFPLFACDAHGYSSVGGGYFAIAEVWKENNELYVTVAYVEDARCAARFRTGPTFRIHMQEHTYCRRYERELVERISLSSIRNAPVRKANRQQEPPG